MIGFAWLQSRTQTLVAAGALAVVAVVTAITGPHLVHVYDTSVATCQAHGDCPAATNGFLQVDHTLSNWLNALVITVPGILGIFWGVPLAARELETGTYRLAWTQSVSRTRWLAVKLGVVGLVSMATAGLLSLAVTWWSSPIDRVSATAFASFAQRDIVPLGYAAFAFALGATAGLIIRRSLPAMASTMVVFVLVRLAFDEDVRPHLISPVVKKFALSFGGFGIHNGGPPTVQPNLPNLPGAWVTSIQMVNRAGQALTTRIVEAACPNLNLPPALGSGPGTGRGTAPVGGNPLEACATKLAPIYHEVVTYQPANRYWAFQWYELAIYLAAAIVLGGLCVWWIRHRLS